MRRKDAGADFAVTEMFFRASDYFGLVERLRRNGADFPIIPGIMPITNLRSIGGGPSCPAATYLPRCWPGSRRERPTRPSARRGGIEIATELCDKLLAGDAPGLHFYTLNRSKATREIYAALSLKA